MVKPDITVDDKGYLVVRFPLKTAMKERAESNTGRTLTLCQTAGRSETFATKEAGDVVLQFRAYQYNPAWREFQQTKMNHEDKEAAEYQAWKASRKEAGVR